MKPTVIVIDETSGREILRERQEDVVGRCVSEIINNRVSELLVLGGTLGLEKPNPPPQAANQSRGRV